MGFAYSRRKQSICWFSLLVVFFISTTVDSSLDFSIRDSAFTALYHRRTGIPYNVPIPANFSGVEASAVLMRGRSLWVAGANLRGALIPPGTTPNPYVRRLALVYQNLANWSSSFYTVEGFTLVSPVVGLLAYNATYFSNSTEIQEIDLKLPRESRIKIQFPELKDVNSSSRCVTFRRGAPPDFTGSPLNNSCLTKTLGHLAIVIPSSPVIPDGIGVPNQNNNNHNKEAMLWWELAVIGGSGAVLMGFLVIRVIGLLKRKKKTRMERRGEEGEALGTILIGGARIPKAEMARTNPILERLPKVFVLPNRLEFHGSTKSRLPQSLSPSSTNTNRSPLCRRVPPTPIDRLSVAEFHQHQSIASLSPSSTNTNRSPLCRRVPPIASLLPVPLIAQSLRHSVAAGVPLPPIAQSLRLPLCRCRVNCEALLTAQSSVNGFGPSGYDSFCHQLPSQSMVQTYSSPLAPRPATIQHLHPTFSSMKPRSGNDPSGVKGGIALKPAVALTNSHLLNDVHNVLKIDKLQQFIEWLVLAKQRNKRV